MKLTNSISRRATSTAVPAQTGLQEAALAADSPVQDLPTFLSELENRQTGRLRSPILDKQGRIMLKNLTRAELADWFEMQGATQLHTSCKVGQSARCDVASTQDFVTEHTSTWQSLIIAVAVDLPAYPSSRKQHEQFCVVTRSAASLSLHMAVSTHAC